MKKILVITVDTNDADYATEQNEITDSQLEKLLPVFASIKSFKAYKGKSKSGLDWSHSNNWPTGECCREDLGEKSPKELYGLTDDQIEMFEDCCPSSEYGFHTVEKVVVLEISKETKYI